ncbi:MAG: hypothetical protein H6811_08135 [Phycisphaeraceae bacterium]|nr:hypothetical protein [Phycisphaeraceae bacterium]
MSAGGSGVRDALGAKIWRKAVALGLSAMLLVGCGGGGSKRSGPAPVNTGLERMARGGAKIEGSKTLAMPRAEPSELERVALDLEGLLRERGATTESDDAPAAREGAADHEPRGSTVAIDVVGDQSEAHSAAPGASEEKEAEVATGAKDGETKRSLDERIVDAASELAALLRERGGPGVTDDALGLAAMETIEPGTLAASGLLEGLSPVERAHVETLARLSGEWSGASAVGTPALLEALERAGDSLRGADPQLRITDALLCTRVVGFGKYDAAPREFLAGQTHRVLVYCAVEHFATREGSGDGLSTVQLSQELTLYHDGPGDLQVWHRARQCVVDSAHRRRRDFFLLNEIELPRRLSVGAYRLKVTTRDEISGAEAEASISIHIVADASLVGRG